MARARGPVPCSMSQPSSKARAVADTLRSIRRASLAGKGVCLLGWSESVLRVLRRRLIGEPRPRERAIEPVAAPIPGEHAAGAISTVGGWRQTDQEQPSTGIAEARQRPRPVALATVAPRWISGGGLAMRDETGTPVAANDARVEPRERIGRGHRRRIVTRWAR